MISVLDLIGLGFGFWRVGCGVGGAKRRGRGPVHDGADGGDGACLRRGIAVGVAVYVVAVVVSGGGIRARRGCA